MVRNVLAWLLIAWAISTCLICLLIVASAAHSRTSRMQWPGRAGDRKTAVAALGSRRHSARDAPIETDPSRPPEPQTLPPKRRHLTVVV
jgi:hypothetical protein